MTEATHSAGEGRRSSGEKGDASGQGGSSAGPPGRSRSTLGPVGLVVAGLLCQEVGASIAVTLFPTVGALGMVTLRLGFSALVLMLVLRPRLHGHTRRDWLVVALFGLVVGGMNMLFYTALDRLPLGTTVTIEVLGPLVLSVVVSRRASAWLWAVLAFAGVALLSQGGTADLDPIGVAFAAATGVFWAAYILLSSRTGKRFEKLDGIAIAMVFGALLSLPFGIASAGSTIIQPRVLMLGLAVALLSSAIPYAFELLSLRRLPEATFSILMSLAPAIAALAGLVILGQALTWVEAVAIGLVIAASIGAVRAARAAPTVRWRGGPGHPATPAELGDIPV